MERAAFKMTAEYRALLGGRGSTLYEEFVDLFTKGIMAARKYATVTITMIEIMMFQVREINEKCPEYPLLQCAKYDE